MLTSKLVKLVKPNLGRHVAALSTAAKPNPIEKPDIKCTGVSLKILKNLEFLKLSWQSKIDIVRFESEAKVPERSWVTRVDLSVGKKILKIHP